MAKNYNIRKSEHADMEVVREASDSRAEAFIEEYCENERELKNLLKLAAEEGEWTPRLTLHVSVFLARHNWLTQELNAKVSEMFGKED